MDKERLALLRAEFKAQIEIIEKLFSDVKNRSERIADNIPMRESCGYKLHSLYCAFEDLFKIVANYFENTIDDRKYYHRELLRRMKLNIPGVRPALLSDESYRLLDELRAFRHHFRHAYNYELDLNKLQTLAEVTNKLIALYKKDFNTFLERLS